MMALTRRREVAVRANLLGERWTHNAGCCHHGHRGRTPFKQTGTGAEGRTTGDERIIDEHYA